jgi:hypothetical protein
VPLRDLLLGARKRELFQLLLDRASQTLLVAMAGVILLLLLGTQILEWYWIVVLLVASVAVGLWRIRHSVPTLYALAQRIDHKLNLADALSTAFFFSENPDEQRAAICDLQRRNAEDTARTVDLKAALPFHRSRYLLPAAGLALVAAGLFAVRYMATGSLDLKPSFVAIAYDTFFGSKTDQAKNQKKLKAKDDQQDPNSPENSSVQNDPPPEDLLNGNDSNEPNQAPDNSKESVDSQKKNEPQTDAKNGEDQGDGKDSSKEEAEQQQKQGDSKKDGSQNAKDSKSGNDSQQSMMDRLKDAMQNLVNSMKPNQENQQQSQNQSKGGQKSDQKGQKGEQSKGEQQQSEAASEQAGQEGEQQQSDQKSAQKSSDKNSQQDAKNGAGSQDGEKARKMAEELAAMGKISQILGQRSAQITGEVTVEVGQSKQQLKTAWSTSDATHKDAGGETHRDEVPLMYQEYVRQYFEEIHKPLPAAVKPAAPKPGATKNAAQPKSSSAP